MDKLTAEEYLKLLEDLTDQQYSDPSEIFTAGELEEYPVVDPWEPADPPLRNKKLPINYNSVADLSEASQEEIKTAIFTSSNIKVDNFSLKITKYHQSINEPLRMDVSLYEKVNRSLSGFPCNIDRKVDTEKDKRFLGRPWSTYFFGGYGMALSPNTVIDVINWLRAIKRFSSFF